MQKLDIGIVESLPEKGITSNELNLLLYVARFQDEYGNIIGIHYNKVCEVLNISPQGFYDALRGLQEKKIITYNHRISDFNITIIGNNKIDTNNFKKGYISVKHPVFRSKDFKNLSAKAKLFMIHLIREESIRKKNTRYKRDSKSLQRIKIDFLEKFSKMLRVSERTIRTYLSIFEKYNFISVYLENGRKYFITFKEGVFRKKENNQKSENAEWREQQVECAIRRNRIKNDSKKSGLLKKLSVYAADIKEIQNFDFSFVVKESLQQQNTGTSNKYKWRRKVNLKMIEKVMVDLISGIIVSDAISQAISTT